MLPNSGLKLFTILLSIWFIWVEPIYAAPPNPTETSRSARVFNLNTQQNQNTQQGLNSFAETNILYLAETHDRKADHVAQLEIVRSLHSKRPLILGMEMFQRPFQRVLDQYLAGKISEAELIRQTEYEKRWGYDWNLYGPIVQFARSHQIPILALNAPSEATRIVARGGLEQLTLKERQWLPPLSTIVAGPAAYRERMRQIYDEMHQGKGSSARFDRFFLAQVLWDETMAHNIAVAHQRNPSALIVVLAGQGHILYGDGIPNRVARRISSQGGALKQATVMLNPPSDVKPELGIADYFWYSPLDTGLDAESGTR